MDALWEPIIAEAEQRLSSPNAGGTWDSLTTVELARALLEVAGSEVASVREASSALLASASSLWQRQRTRSGIAHVNAAASEAAFQCAPLCRLLGMLAIALCRTVGVEEPSGVQRRLRPWTDCCTELGLREPALCALLDGRSKGLLLYLAMVERGDARLKLGVDRGGALWEALSQWAASPFHDEDEAPHSVKLFPRFHGEAGEGHGPRKELFAILGTQMLHGPGADHATPAVGAAGATPAVLPYAASSRQHWFDASRARSRDGEQLCRFAGWLMGQAVCNRAHLEGAVALPTLLFRCLLAEGGRPAASLELLTEFDPPAAANLQSVVAMSAADFGAMCELEDLDPQSTTRAQYVQTASERLLFGDGVGWQLDAVSAGFRRALPPEVLERVQLTPAQLASVVCGASDGGADADFALETTFRIALAADEFEGSEPLTESMWAVLGRWTPADKRRFVKFVTGSDRLPPRGTEVITLQVAQAEIGRRAGRRQNATLGMLPQAHTCDNLLELPNYWEALCESRGVPLTTRGAEATALIAELELLLQQRLTMAVHECDVYGLDDGYAPPTRSHFTSTPAIPVGACVGINSTARLPPDATPGVPTASLPPPAAYYPPAAGRLAAEAAVVADGDDEAELDTLLAGFSPEASPLLQPIHVADAPSPVPVRAPMAVPDAPPAGGSHLPSLSMPYDVGDMDVDDLIHELGDLSPSSPLPPSARARFPASEASSQPPGVATLSILPPTTRRDDSHASKLTAAEIDLDLEIEALDL